MHIANIPLFNIQTIVQSDWVDSIAALEDWLNTYAANAWEYSTAPNGSYISIAFRDAKKQTLCLLVWS